MVRFADYMYSNIDKCLVINNTKTKINNSNINIPNHKSYNYLNND